MKLVPGQEPLIFFTPKIIKASWGLKVNINIGDKTSNWNKQQTS